MAPPLVLSSAKAKATVLFDVAVVTATWAARVLHDVAAVTSAWESSVAQFSMIDKAVLSQH